MNGRIKILTAPVHLGSLAENLDETHEEQASIWLNSRKNNSSVSVGHGRYILLKAVSTPVPVANWTLALESGLRPHEVQIDRPRTVHAQLN